MKEKIFFVEDEESIYDLIDATLAVGGYEKKGFVEPLAMIAELEKNPPHLIVLDLMLPNMNGYDVLRELKDNYKFRNIPVIILSAKSSEIDKVKGLDMGAADYITKPFGILEFLSRIKANIRKTNIIPSEIIQVGDLELDLVKHCCTIQDSIIDLTVKEYQIVQALMEFSSAVVTREKLLNIIWGSEHITETRTLDMHIKSIREKFLKVSGDMYIETVRGIGYIIKGR